MLYEKQTQSAEESELLSQWKSRNELPCRTSCRPPGRDPSSTGPFSPKFCCFGVTQCSHRCPMQSNCPASTHVTVEPRLTSALAFKDATGIAAVLQLPPPEARAARLRAPRDPSAPALAGHCPVCVRTHQATPVCKWCQSAIWTYVRSRDPRCVHPSPLFLPYSEHYHQLLTNVADPALTP
jgi:hypothetical protein